LTAPKALEFAIRKDSKKLLQLLLDTWTDSDGAGGSVGSALHFAASRGDIDFMRMLLNHPKGVSDVNQEAGTYGTALHAAISGDCNQLEMVQLLLEKGANPEIDSGLYGTALNTAAYTQQYEIAELLLKRLPRDNVTSVTGNYGTPIQSAIAGYRSASTPDGVLRMLELLHTNGASASAAGGLYGTPLHAAAQVSISKPVVTWLLEKEGVSAECLDVVGRLPLHLAIENGNWDMVQQLSTTEKATIRTTDKQGRNGLHYAAVSGSSAVIGEILGNGKNQDLVGSVDGDKWTPLHWACRRPNVDIVHLLIEQKAKRTARTSEGWIPRQIAMLHDNTDVDYLELLPDTSDKGGGLPEGAGRRFPAYCDACFCVSTSSCLTPGRSANSTKTIYWKRYHCTSKSCKDYDLCFKCYGHVCDIHYEGHEFQEQIKV
jgi:ankyrin repeat protein